MTDDLSSFSFGQPWWLLLLLLLPLLARLRTSAGPAPAVPFSALEIVRSVSRNTRTVPGQRYFTPALAVLALSILAMARPRVELGESRAKRQGVDIVFCVDVSGSMDTDGFMHQGRKITNRQALIQAIGQFVDHRPNDRFGMIGFAKDTYLMSPLTIDGEWIKSVLKEIQLKSWTAIGEGIVSSVNLLKVSKSPSRVIIVASDGGNNQGISPIEAAKLAQKEKIKIHTVQFMPPGNVAAANANSLMSNVAKETGGLYFQASSLDSMLSIYREIDRMEKVPFKQKQNRLYNELFAWFLLSAGAILLLGWLGGNTLWLRIP